MALYKFSDGSELSKFMHVERAGHTEVEGLFDGDVYVQEKIDGANLTVAFDEIIMSLIICSRNRLIYSNGRTHDPFNSAVAYVLEEHDGIEALFSEYPNWVLRGEWLRKHQVKYDEAAYGHFYVYDVQDRADEMRYLRPEEYQKALADREIKFVPIDVRLAHPSPKDLKQYAMQKSGYGEVREGIVAKRYGWKNKWGHVVWAKVLNDTYDQKLKDPSAKVKEPVEPGHLEQQFVEQFITDSYVLKEIYKLRDELGRKVEAKDIPRVMGQVWHEAFKEELWDFIKNAKRVGGGKPIEFVRFQGLVQKAARAVVLRYTQGEFD